MIPNCDTTQMLNRDSKESIKCQSKMSIFTEFENCKQDTHQDHLSHFINKTTLPQESAADFLHGHTVCVEESQVGFNLFDFQCSFH